ncbi:unnamed protein product [Eruca vesicaria subsp. sativa]|uniref:Uncharacterized protein n=1 Tax=Eruca vesicaria subsp. sativa TaxID=29727 RepID=A0ABC8M9I3_ERUVS|nr:unnamed protein product [Eruca vesicaria subsp. sativa]
MSATKYLARVSQVRQEEPLAENKSSLHAISSNVMDSDLSLLARREPLPSAVSIYNQDPVLSATLARVSAAFVTQVSHTMQIPFSYAEDIIGLEGANISLHPRTKRSYQFISNHKEPASVSGGYARGDTGYVPAVYPPQLSNRQEPLSSSYTGTETVQYRPTSYSQLPGQTYETEYRPASDVNGYSSYIL